MFRKKLEDFIFKILHILDDLGFRVESIGVTG